MSVFLMKETLHIIVVILASHKRFKKILYLLHLILSLAITSSPCRLNESIFKLRRVNLLCYPLSIPALVWYQQPIQTVTRSDLFIIASCTEGIPVVLFSCFINFFDPFSKKIVAQILSMLQYMATNHILQVLNSLQ